MSECSRPQCCSDDPTSLHNGYVAHRNAGEPACEASLAGHAEYVRIRRRQNTEKRAS